MNLQKIVNQKKTLNRKNVFFSPIFLEEIIEE